MVTIPSLFEHPLNSIDEIRSLLAPHRIKRALLKPLPKNANDKNQVYVASDFGVLYDRFGMTFAERGDSTSIAKQGSAPGRRITEASFDQFEWLKRDGTLARAKRVKAIVYPQYPESRLSGFLTIEGEMPPSMSVSYTKENPDAKRLLVLGEHESGACVAVMVVDYGPELETQLKKMPGTHRARAWKTLDIQSPKEMLGIDKLKMELVDVVGQEWLGSRLDVMGNVLPFNGTQVCGYTLERALGITPNSSKDGDIYGIELKTHTSPRLTLFTPEPDIGLYAQDFSGFMQKYGYKDSDGNYRLTGTHRAGRICEKSGLTLDVVEYRPDKNTGEWIVDSKGRKKPFPFNPNTNMSAKVDSLEVILTDQDGEIAAGWSFERLMNCWGAKHNHVVYVPARKETNHDTVTREQGYGFRVKFAERVMMGVGTSAEQLFKAIATGTIYLDPAPKLMATGSKHKRRCQWRIANIGKALDELYDNVYEVHLKKASVA